MRFLFFIAFVAYQISTAAQPISDFQFVDEGQSYNLEAWMSLNNTPGLSFYMESGEEESHAWQYGNHLPNNSDGFDDQTIFPMGALSKFPVAFLTLRLVELGKIELDAPVNNYLLRWQIPGNRAGQVTVRDLLLSRKKWKSGYKPRGYPTDADLPGIVELLEGPTLYLPDGIRLKGRRSPGADTEYGNWLVLQLLVEDQFGGNLPEVAQREIFEPLGMHHSFYASELSTEQAAKAAWGHDESGTPLQARFRYPELAAAGLWSTPTDYARFVRHVQEAANGEDNRLLGQELAKAGLEKAHGVRSLIFHINEYGDPYGGGNCQGYYVSFGCSRAYGWINVAASNRHLNWRVVNYALGQTHDWLLAQNR
ncbi:MAG: serine hydrolase domain-containing protein [Bacteroidota bacterium]